MEAEIDIQGPAESSALCPWTYQLQVDENRSPSVLVVARCLSASDQCETVNAVVEVDRRNSTTGQLYQVTERFAVACRRKLTRPTPEPTSVADPVSQYNDEHYNHDDYSQ